VLTVDVSLGAVPALNSAQNAHQRALTPPLHIQYPQTPKEEYEEDEDEGFAPTPVVFSVTVSKGDALMGFKCVGGGDYVRVTHVELDDAGEAANYTPYSGPVFDELDETLQQAFVDYLDERGGRLLAGRVWVLFWGGAPSSRRCRQVFVDCLDERGPPIHASCPHAHSPLGITPEFGSYLVELVADKLEVEYMNWLGRVRTFLEKGADG
jgi:hypothetical protein